MQVGQSFDGEDDPSTSIVTGVLFAGKVFHPGEFRHRVRCRSDGTISDRDILIRNVVMVNDVVTA